MGRETFRLGCAARRRLTTMPANRKPVKRRGSAMLTDPMSRCHSDLNQNPEQIARTGSMTASGRRGWNVQDNKAIDFNAGLGIAVREYQTDIGPADYVLFV